MMNPKADAGPPPLTKDQLADRLGGWKGYQLGTMGRLPVDPDHPEEVWLELVPDPNRSPRGSGCGQVVRAIHGVEERWVRDLPLLGRPVERLVQRCRLACPQCGPKLEPLDWLAPYARVTRRLAREVARLCHWLPVQHVAAFFGLHRHTVKALDKAHMTETLGPPDLSGLAWSKERRPLAGFARSGCRGGTFGFHRRPRWLGSPKAGGDAGAPIAGAPPQPGAPVSDRL